MSNDVVEVNYVLKTCGFPPTGKQFAECPGGTCTKDTACGAFCATKCFEDFVKKQAGATCVEDHECVSGSCGYSSCFMCQSSSGNCALNFMDDPDPGSPDEYWG